MLRGFSSVFIGDLLWRHGISKINNATIKARLFDEAGDIVKEFETLNTLDFIELPVDNYKNSYIKVVVLDTSNATYNFKRIVVYFRYNDEEYPAIIYDFDAQYTKPSDRVVEITVSIGIERLIPIT